MKWYQIKKCSDCVRQNDYTFGVYDYKTNDDWIRLRLIPTNYNGNGSWYVKKSDLQFLMEIK